MDAGRLPALLTAPPGDPPEHLRSLLASLPALWDALSRPDRRVTFLGLTQAGKSSLLNALLGAPVLPIRANRATGTVIAVQHGSPPRAVVRRKGALEAAIPLGAVASAALLDLTTGVGRERDEIDEIRIQLPLPLLPERCVLVDTPGLLEHQTLTELVYRELERTDLAVLVLAADKLLSERERQVARHLHALLNGNIIYVVNRLDLIDAEDRAEVVAWAGQALQGSGNRLVGAARIFPSAVPPAGLNGGQTDAGVSALRDWLGDVLLSAGGERVARLARLGILARRLATIAEAARQELSTARQATLAIEAEEATTLAQQRAAIVARLTEARARLSDRDFLRLLAERFVARTVDDTRPDLAPAASGAAPLHLRFESALADFGAGVAEQVQSLLAGLPVTTLPFDLAGWIMRAEVRAVTHPSSDLGTAVGGLLTRPVDGGEAGRAAGASIGGWIGKNVFGVDAERETLRRVAAVARSVASSLRAEAERYLDRVDALLAEATAYYRGWTPASARLVAARERERQRRELVRWCEQLLSEVQSREGIPHPAGGPPEGGRR